MPSVKEGAFLLEHGISPYQGRNCQHPPLILSAYYWVPQQFLPILYTAVDIGISISLGSLVNVTSFGSAAESSAEMVVLCYLFNPLILLSTLSRSSAIFSNWVIAAALSTAAKQKLFASALLLAIGAYLSLYPAILIAPCVFLLSQNKSFVSVLAKFVFLMLVSLLCLMAASFTLFDSWAFLDSFYGCIIFLSDFSPNIGLFWYVFIEMFDHFRSLFIFIFQLNIFTYTIPCSIKFKNEPMFLAFILLAVIAIFKSYPSIGEVGFYISFIPFFKPLFKYTTSNIIVVNAFVYCMIISVAYWYWWISQGSGNANFYYAITLVISITQIILVINFTMAALKSQIVKLNPQVELQKLHQE